MQGTFWVYIRRETAVEYLYIHTLWIFFWDVPFLSRLCEIYLSIKDLEILAEFNLLQKLHLCAQTSVCATNFGPLGEFGANFSLQLSSRIQFAKINSKKVIAENQCEKHKKSSLVVNSGMSRVWSCLRGFSTMRWYLHILISISARKRWQPRISIWPFSTHPGEPHV